MQTRTLKIKMPIFQTKLAYEKFSIGVNIRVHLILEITDEIRAIG